MGLTIRPWKNNHLGTGTRLKARTLFKPAGQTYGEHLKHNEQTRELIIDNRLGLHARAAARLVEVAQQFQSEVTMEKNGRAADAKSVVCLLALECPLGTKVTVRARGEDARPAVSAVAELIEAKFGEE